MYVYIKDDQIVSNCLVEISKEADRVVELDYDDSQPFYCIYLDENGDPVLDYYTPAPDQIES